MAGDRKVQSSQTLIEWAAGVCGWCSLSKSPQKSSSKKAVKMTAIWSCWVQDSWGHPVLLIVIQEKAGTHLTVLTPSEQFSFWGWVSSLPETSAWKGLMKDDLGRSSQQWSTGEASRWHVDRRQGQATPTTWTTGQKEEPSVVSSHDRSTAHVCSFQHRYLIPSQEDREFTILLIFPWIWSFDECSTHGFCA